MAKALASRNMDNVRFAQRETRINRCMAMGPFGKSHQDCLNRGASHAGFERPERAWLMRRDAPGGSVGGCLGSHMAGLLCDWGMCRSGGRSTPVLLGRGTCGEAGGEAGGRTAPEASDFCQTCGPAS